MLIDDNDVVQFIYPIPTNKITLVVPAKKTNNACCNQFFLVNNFLHLLSNFERERVAYLPNNLKLQNPLAHAKK